MAEPTTKFTVDTLSYIVKYGALASKYGSAYGVSSYAVMGAIANELDTRYNPDLMFDKRGGFVQGITDKAVVKWGLGSYSHKDLVEFYNRFQSGELTIKFFNPVAVDIGPGNIKVSTAIEIVRAYAAEYQGKGQDPLDLLKYSNAYGALINDLLSFDKPDTSFAISAAYVKQGEAFFISKDAAAWDRLTPDQQDALLVTYYKIGPATLGKNIDARIAAAEKNGEQFNFNPNGDGGAQHLRNLDAIKLLSGPRCFLAGTPILMADGSTKPIEDIRPGDEVAAFDPEAEQGLGPLQPGKVTRLFTNVANTIINLRGLHMTPGHVVLMDKGEWDIIARALRDDRGIVEQRGDKARARPLGSGNRLRNPEQLCRSPFASTAPHGAQSAAALTAAG